MADRQQHGPAATAPTVTHNVIHCNVCHTQRQSRGDSDESGGCSFCGAGREAITIVSEDASYGGRVLQ